MEDQNRKDARRHEDIEGMSHNEVAGKTATATGKATHSAEILQQIAIAIAFAYICICCIPLGHLDDARVTRHNLQQMV
jgi:hypothetical protein